MKSPPVLPRSEQTRKTEQQQAERVGDCRIRNVGDFFFFLIKRLISWNPDFFFFF